MLVDSEKLGTGAALSEAEKMQRERKGTVSLKGIVTYDWSADGKTILVPLDGVLYLAGLHGLIAALVAVVLSVPLAFVLLARPRARFAATIEQRVEAQRARRAQLDEQLAGDEDSAD